MKPKHVKCKDVFRHICDNLDHNLESPECHAIKEHIDGCPDCIVYLDSLKQTIRLFREYPDPKVPAKAHRKLYAILKLPVPQTKRK
jgi:predicted anti-sigma-YlaC factor YlaD